MPTTPNYSYPSHLQLFLPRSANCNMLSPTSPPGCLPTYCHSIHLKLNFLSLVSLSKYPNSTIQHLPSIQLPYCNLLPLPETLESSSTKIFVLTNRSQLYPVPVRIICMISGASVLHLILILPLPLQHPFSNQNLTTAILFILICLPIISTNSRSSRTIWLVQLPASTNSNTSLPLCTHSIG